MTDLTPETVTLIWGPYICQRAQAVINERHCTMREAVSHALAERQKAWRETPVNEVLVGTIEDIGANEKEWNLDFGPDK